MPSVEAQETVELDLSINVDVLSAPSRRTSNVDIAYNEAERSRSTNVWYCTLPAICDF